MTNQKITILGCGWLGKALGRVLVDAGHQVMGSTTKPANTGALEVAGITPVVFTTDELLSPSLPGLFNCDVLVISLPHGARKGKAEAYVDDIKRVVAAAQSGKVKSIVLISTTSVYPNLNRVVAEQDADVQNPIVRAERMVMASGIGSTVIRFGGLFGPGRDPGRFLAGKRDVSGANVPVNMIHLDDCVHIIKKVIDNNHWHQVFNACADGHPTKKAFYTQAALALGVEPPMFSDDADAPYKIVSNEHLKSTMNYTFIRRLM